MRFLLLAVLVLARTTALSAQSVDWADVDFAHLGLREVNAILAQKPPLDWEGAVETSVNDPMHRFVPGDRVDVFLLALTYSKDVEVIQALIAAGASCSRTDSRAPLMYAAEFNPNPAVLKMLMDHGAQVSAPLGYSLLARPALTYAAQYNPAPAVIDELIGLGAIVDAKVSTLDNMGYTSLMYAAQYNSNAAVVEELINKGAAVDLPDAMARTPLILAAAYNKNPQVVKALIDHGADVNVTSRDYYNVGWTPLMYAAASDHDPLAKVAFLLAAGANARVRSKEGKLALDYARGNNLVSQEDHVYRLLEEASNSY